MSKKTKKKTEIKLPQYGHPIPIQGGSLNKLVKKCIGPCILHLIEPPYRKDTMNPSRLASIYERYTLAYIEETGTWAYRFQGTTEHHLFVSGETLSKKTINRKGK